MSRIPFSAPIGPLAYSGTVIALYPPNKVEVLIDMLGGSTTVFVGSDSQNDPLRVQAKPLPKIGTKVAVQFLNLDPRAGFIIKALPTNLQSAYPSQTDPDITYTSENSGHSEIRTGAGNGTINFADGSQLVMSNAGDIPLYRTVVENNQPLFQATTQAELCSTPAAPFSFSLTTKGGITISAVGQVITVQNTDGSSLVINGTTGTLTLPGGLIVDANQTVNGNLQVNGTIGATGNISSNQTVVAAVDVTVGSKSYVGHYHGNVENGTGITGTPQG